MKSPDELTEIFRARGLKMTPQRQCIFRVLHRLAGAHPTAEAVYAAVVEELPTVSLKTVYQTLNDLSAMGELQHIDLGTGSGRFDVNLDLHQHLVCDRCGRVWDVYADFTEVRVPADLATGFRVSSTDIVFRGTCEACAASTAGVPV
ncbi:MAG TPA: Fur family transcriptional regulator [Acidimicrobiales bacterium]|nr:Fur family transcriptional regulator [Acidimicrobiales bacterium]